MLQELWGLGSTPESLSQKFYVYAVGSVRRSVPYPLIHSSTRTTNMENILITLMKIVKCERYAKDLLNGKLYCNSIQWFRENHDEFEGNSYIFVESITFGGRTISRDHMIGPVMFHDNNAARRHAYCMFRWSAPIADSRVEINLPEQIGDLEKLARKFGQHTVVVNATEFLNRVDKEVKERGIPGRRGVVHYADRSDLKPDSPRTPAFNKPNRFAEEKEYRFLFKEQTPNCGETAFCIDIGDIHDIAVCMNTEDIYPLVARIGTKAFCETYIGLKSFGEEHPKSNS